MNNDEKMTFFPGQEPKPTGTYNSFYSESQTSVQDIPLEKPHVTALKNLARCFVENKPYDVKDLETYVVEYAKWINLDLDALPVTSASFRVFVHGLIATVICAMLSHTGRTVQVSYVQKSFKNLHVDPKVHSLRQGAIGSIFVEYAELA